MESGAAEWTGWLLEQWTAALAGAVETMSGQRPEAAWAAAAGGSGDPNLLWWEQPFDAAPRAVVWAGAPEAVWTELGSSVLRSAGIEPTDALDSRNTYLEIVTQALMSLAQALSARLGRKVNAGEGSETAPPPADTNLHEVRLGGSASPLYFTFGPAIADLFETRLSAPDEVTSPEPAPAAAAPQAPAPADAGPGTLDLLMDVELPVSVSFGRAELPLKDVLKLTTGSIVELNRAISEPVEVIVNNSVIARGEVVVVEGNYGIKISEIISRESRLRTLK